MTLSAVRELSREYAHGELDYEQYVTERNRLIRAKICEINDNTAPTPSNKPTKNALPIEPLDAAPATASWRRPVVPLALGTIALCIVAGAWWLLAPDDAAVIATDTSAPGAVPVFQRLVNAKTLDTNDIDDLVGAWQSLDEEQRRALAKTPEYTSLRTLIGTEMQRQLEVAKASGQPRDFENVGKLRSLAQFFGWNDLANRIDHLMQAEVEQ